MSFGVECVGWKFSFQKSHFVISFVWMCFTCVACLIFRLNNKSFYAKISSSVLKMAGGVKQIFARTPNDKSNVWAWNLWKIPEVALEKSSCLNVEIIKLCG